MKRFKNILYVVEPGNGANPALERAVELASNNQAHLTALSIAPSVNSGIDIPDYRYLSADIQLATINVLKEQLDDVVAPYDGQVDITTKVAVGTPFLEIIKEVLRGEHDMVIKSPESLDWLDRFFSGNDKHLLRKCPCPVWMVPRTANTSFKRILAAVDIAQGYPVEETESRASLNQTIMQLSSSLALSEFAELHIVHAWEALGESAMRHGSFVKRPENEVDAYVDEVHEHNERLLTSFINETSSSLGKEVAAYIKPGRHLLKGPARKMIPEIARELHIDCIVMGTLGRSGVPGLIIGNTAETIIDQLECSVLAIKPPGFVSPVTLDT